MKMKYTLFAKEFESHAWLYTCPARSSQSSHTWTPPAGNSIMSTKMIILLTKMIHFHLHLLVFLVEVLYCVGVVLRL